MNYYERIQKSINFIEEHLCDEFSLQMCADEAYMSLSGYYRIFLSISGYTVKEYIRLRRLNCALEDLSTNPQMTVLDTAIKYAYNSADGFTRSFKNQFGILPSQVKTEHSQKNIMKFERLNILDQLLENDDKDLFERYPDIKVIRDLDEMKVACYTYYGKDPECHAFSELKQWFHEHELVLEDSAYRLFGYNNPDPEEGATSYGYEYCITIPEELYEKLEEVPADLQNQTYPKVYRKILPGGKYAVMSVKRGKDGDIGQNIMAAWKRFMKWMGESKYIWGRNQYLEEHLGFSKEDDHIGGVDLYFSIDLAPNNLAAQIKEEVMPASKVIVFREEGTSNFGEICGRCWNHAMSFAKQSGLNSKECKLYQYNQGFEHPETLFHVIMITVPEDYQLLEEDQSKCKLSQFPGGPYAVAPATFENDGQIWVFLEKWRKQNKKKLLKNQWVEEVEHRNWEPTGNVKCYYSVK